MDFTPLLALIQTLVELIITQVLPGVLAAVLLLLAGRFLINTAVRVVEITARRSRVKQAQIDLLKATTRAIGLILLLAGVLQALGLSQLALALGGTISFVALGIATAASGNLGDIIAGVFLASDPDFGNGFRIKTGEIDGVIEQIDLRKTRVRADDGKLYVIPNKEIENKVWIVQARPQQPARSQEGGRVFLRRTSRARPGDEQTPMPPGGPTDEPPTLPE
jgi:small-conductance mechanosensitive channel